MLNKPADTLDCQQSVVSSHLISDRLVDTLLVEAMRETKAIVINIDHWVKENGDYLKPPIGNKLIFDRQLKVFLVAGPNQRTDYHIENGEEIIIMIKGDMKLDVIEQGKPKSIIIKQGEMFVLPARIPHSPQRSKDTLGLVIERERLDNEMDCLRYYCDSNCNQVLFEKWFHCYSLDTDLPPIIDLFKCSVEYATGQPTQLFDNSISPHPDDQLKLLPSPIGLIDWFKYNEQSLKESFAFIHTQSEESKIGFYGPGQHTFTTVDIELFIWFLGTHAQCTIDDDNQHLLTYNDTLVVQRGSILVLTSDGPTLIASMEPFTSTMKKSSNIVPILAKMQIN